MANLSQRVSGSAAQGFRVSVYPRRVHVGSVGFIVYPKALRTHNMRLLGPKTVLYKAFGLL